METGSKPAGQALFQSVSDDGSHWLFIILPDERWMITRNGDRVAIGAGRSVSAGVDKFRTLTAISSIPARCGAAIHAQTARLETKAS